MKKNVLFFLLIGLAASAVAQEPSLTAKEKKAGWILLFDGKDFAGWQKANGKPMGDSGWVAANGVLSTTGHGHGGDIVTNREFTDFEFTLDFKLEKGTNSGIKYHLLKNSSLGCEYQIIDDANHVDAKLGKNGDRTLAALYDLIPPSADKKVMPLGEWNHVRIISKGNHAEHWLNGKKMLEYERGSEAFKKLVAESKFKNEKGFSEPNSSPILLQEHGDVIHYRNIKIRNL
ncbi:MAG: DUF1080 domain-containing protein [Chitinophagaceae bacterium]